jgi:hypothetical protein
MILVRDVMQLEFGKAKEAKAVWKEGAAVLANAGFTSVRVLTDLTGPFYTFVLETTYPSLEQYEQITQKMFGTKEWAEWYQKLQPLIESGRREMYTIVE